MTQSGSGELTRWIARLFEHPELLRMGHNQREEDLNLGLGWLYYALARIIRPSRAVVIGSYRGFVPLVIAKAFDDNLDPGELVLIDPSLVDDFWTDPEAVREYVRSFGLDNVRHFRLTTQQFVETPEYRKLGELGLLFIDGYHSEEQARFDFRSFEGLLAPRAVALLHDSVVLRPTAIYGTDKVYDIRVKCFVDELKQDPGLQVFDLPYGTGLTLVRKLDETSAEPLLEGLEARP